MRARIQEPPRKAVMFANFPQFSAEHYAQLTETLDPISVVDGYSVKRGDLFRLGDIVNGSKVRQCLHVVQHFRSGYGGLITGAGLPSPQIAIVAAVAKYFGLKCAIVTLRYRDGLRDFDRINSSLAQKLGADIYGVCNPRSSGYEKEARTLAERLGYLQIKFGMYGSVALEPVIRQVQNVPEYVERVVVISGSGLSALSIIRGLARFGKKHVKRVDVVALGDHFRSNRGRFYSIQREEVFDGEIYVHESPWLYRQRRQTSMGEFLAQPPALER